MKAMVFAAGYGQRLCPTTEKLPKAFVPVAGRPMIEYPLLLLRHYGIREVIINLHHLGDQIETHLKDGKELGLEITYSKEKELLDTGGGLLQAKPFLADDTFIVINCDVIIDLPLATLIDEHRKRTATGTLVLRPDPDADHYGAIEISPDSRIQRFLGYSAQEKRQEDSLTKLMFTGVQILEPKVFEYMAPDINQPVSKFGITKITYPKMLTRGEPLYGYGFNGYWQHLGTWKRIEETAKKLARGEMKLHFLGKNPNTIKR